MTGDEKPPCQPLMVHLTCAGLMSPFAVASTATILPISLESRFSSLCVTIAVVPCTTTPVLSPRLLISYLHTGSPVCGLIAWISPSLAPWIRRRIPLTVTMIGGAYVVSSGRIPGELIQSDGVGF